MTAPSLPPASKTCSVCHEPQPLKNFTHHGLQCRACRNAKANPEKARARSTAWQRKNPEKANARSRAWRQKNLEKARASNREWHRKNRERSLARRRAWRLKNRAKVCALAQIWARNHPETIIAAVNRRRARKANAAINDFTAAQWQEMLLAYDHRCVYCDRKMQRLTQDHIIPLIKGGNHTKSNIVPACQSCNSKKGTGAPLVPVQPLLI